MTGGQGRLDGREQQAVAPRRTRGGRVLTVAAWLSGIVAMALTALLIRVVLAMVEEWSDYVGGESTTALVVLGFVGAATAAAWLITWGLVRMRRS